MPMTTKTVAARCTMMDLRVSFSRPKRGAMRVRMMPMKKMTIGSEESEIAEAMAMDGAKASAPR